MGTVHGAGAQRTEPLWHALDVVICFVMGSVPVS